MPICRASNHPHGGADPPWLKDEIDQWLRAGRIWELYGGTERQGACVISGVEWLAHKGSGRQDLETARLHIIGDDRQRRAAPGAAGEIYFLPMTAPAAPVATLAPSRSAAPNGWESPAISDEWMPRAISISATGSPT